MKIRRMLIAGAMAVAATLGLAAPAFAITQTECDPDTGWLKIYYVKNGVGDRACFANAGSMNTNFPNGFRVSSGNNAGNVEFIDTDGVRRYRPFGRWETHDFLYLTIVKVTIY